MTGLKLRPPHYGDHIFIDKFFKFYSVFQPDIDTTPLLRPILHQTISGFIIEAVMFHDYLV